ncbi:MULTISPECIES: TrmH family RNA methyltransferase [Flavobacterium]|uniref:RNA methyltransferase n=2 Tax=Flavobacterium TaxID=237 RepID=A0AA94F200_9FLAO|nr:MULTISPECIES: RNA methyltransferase [Flavobacterium]OXA74760.1 rRNA methyltransferase [Flavobacterium columnare] [Flavobacterium columnare NBRC 100251 = ATCC 23463]AMA48943.1 rRNA methyltransferase [Flavobacterium covae]AND64926.1 rRNA methyltransferase [Flavobacterium covae]MCH4830913.1 RNA methyltransferase [Flavobacterium columnare]MCH4833146.1 RNA methyltransferase [Flavobacterium columnare]
MKQISSIQNPYIKSLNLLQEKAKERKKTGTFLIEGIREIELAKKGGYQIDSILICTEILPVFNPAEFECSQVIEISKEVYHKLAYRDTTEGILAVAKMKSFELTSLKLPQNPLILVAEAPEKPGNIGALLRTADAANLDAVIIANPKNDLYNPNIVRSSVGCLFTNQIATGTTDEIIDFLKTNNIPFYAATLQNSTNYHTQDYTKPTALVVGTEATGLSEAWRTEATQNIIIPMQGAIDSMNVSVAAAILIFEAKRQRNFK